MSLIGLLVVVVVVGLVCWLLSTLPIPQPFQTIIYVILVLIVIVWLLNAIGVFSGPIRLR